MAMAIHVLTGTIKGQEFLLPEEGEFPLAKSKGDDELIINQGTTDKVAVLTAQGDQISIKDIKADGGTFVNRRRIESATLKEGDQVRVGKMRFVLVKVTKYSPVLKAAKARAAAKAALAEAKANALVESKPKVAEASTPTPPANELPRPRAPQPKTGQPSTSGSLNDVYLADVLRFLCANLESGVLSLLTEGDIGAVQMSKGRIADAFIASSPAPNAKRALYRLFRWKNGEYLFQPGEAQPVEAIFNESLEELLRQAEDERDGIDALEAALPRLDTKLAVAKLPPGGLSKLTPPEMFILGLVRMHGTVSAIIDHHPENDLVVCKHLVALLRRNVICIAAL